ncbi:MAG: hypothetical protein UC361_03275 [Bulleidia sp.]|nr:hypothetical protein [Bulleidia sp.]
MRCVGYRRSQFTTKDGKEISGYNIFTEQTITENGKGMQTDKFYLSDAKIRSFGLDLDNLVGEEIIISYNRWGKVAEVILR